MIQTFIAIKDEKIIGRFITSQGVAGVKKSAAADAEIVEIPDASPAQTGIPVGFFDEAWKLRPLPDLIKDGLVKLDPTEKIEGSAVVKKTLGELIDEGLEKVPAGTLYDAKTDSLIPDPAYIPPKPTVEALSAELAALIERAKIVEAEIKAAGA